MGKARSVESGVEAQNWLGSANADRAPQGIEPSVRRAYIRSEKMELGSKAEAERQSENRKGRESRTHNQNHGTQHQDHTESEARMEILSLLSRFPSFGDSKRRKRKGRAS